MRIRMALQDIFACTRQPPPTGGFFSHEAKKQCKTALTSAMQKRIIHSIAAHKAATGEADRRTSKSPLKIQPLRFATKTTAGAHSRRERELTWCYRRAAKHWNVTAPRGDWKSRGNGTDRDQQSAGQSRSRNPSGDMSARAFNRGPIPKPCGSGFWHSTGDRHDQRTDD